MYITVRFLGEWVLWCRSIQNPKSVYSDRFIIFVLWQTLLSRYNNEWKTWSGEVISPLYSMKWLWLDYLTNVFSEHSSCQFSGIKHTIPSANEAQPGVEQRCYGIHTLLYWIVMSGVTLLSAFWWFPFINLASATQPEINLTGYGNEVKWHTGPGPGKPCQSGSGVKLETKQPNTVHCIVWFNYFSL